MDIKTTPSPKQRKPLTPQGPNKSQALHRLNNLEAHAFFDEGISGSQGAIDPSVSSILDLREARKLLMTSEETDSITGLQEELQAQISLQTKQKSSAQNKGFLGLVGGAGLTIGAGIALISGVSGPLGAAAVTAIPLGVAAVMGGWSQANRETELTLELRQKNRAQRGLELAQKFDPSPVDSIPNRTQISEMTDRLEKTLKTTGTVVTAREASVLDSGKKALLKTPGEEGLEILKNTTESNLPGLFNLVHEAETIITKHTKS